jgi:hypothetical protein
VDDKDACAFCKLDADADAASDEEEDADDNLWGSASNVPGDDAAFGS